MTTVITERPAAPGPEAAVIVPHFDDAARLARCLDALAPQVADGRVEVVVVDNGSAAPLDPLPARHPGMRFLVERAPGAAAARNRGVAESVAPLLFFLDADCLPAPDWIARALALAPAADLTGGRVEVFDEVPLPRSGAAAFEAVFAFDCRRYVQRRGFSVTANLLTHRRVFEAVGPFRPGVAEDRDWCRRAGRLGFGLVYADTLVVGHPARADWPALAGKWRRIVREGHAGRDAGLRGRTVWLAAALAQPLLLCADLPRVAGSRKLRSAGERLRAAAVLSGLRLCKFWWMLRQAGGVAI